MHWIAPSKKDDQAAGHEKRLWDAADQFRAYSGPILGLIFLRFAEVRFAAQRTKLEQAGASSRRINRVDEPFSTFRRRAAARIRSQRELVR